MKKPERPKGYIKGEGTFSRPRPDTDPPTKRPKEPQIRVRGDGEMPENKEEIMYSYYFLERTWFNRIKLYVKEIVWVDEMDPCDLKQTTRIRPATKMEILKFIKTIDLNERKF